MNTKYNDLAAPLSLMPYQTELVEGILSPVGNHLTLLRSIAGLGKSTTLAVAASRLIRARPEARVLILCPSGLCSQFADRVRHENIPAVCVDRYKFREMLDLDNKTELWPVGVVNVLSYDFAKKPDVRESLARVSWDLLVGDEAHQLTGLRMELFRHIEPLAKRVVLSTATTASGLSSLTDEASVVDWSPEILRDNDGNALSNVVAPEIHDVQYTLTPSEQRIVEALRQLAVAVESSSPVHKLKAAMLLRSYRSSVSALEERLKSFLLISNDIADPQELSLESNEDDLCLDHDGRFELPMPERARLIAEQLLRELDEIKVDSKLDCLGMLLMKIAESAQTPRRVLIQTDYLTTLYYLAADLEGREIPCEYIHGRMTLEDRLEALGRCSEGKGVLLGTSAARDGLNLSGVTDLILYDGVKRETVNGAMLNPFHRYGRKAMLENVYAFEAY